MNVMILKIKDVENFELYSKHLKFISTERRIKIERFKFNHLKTISLFAELLTRFQISKELNIPYQDIKFKYNRYGKPLLDSKFNYWFSISHSNDYVVVVNDNSPIGIDIEQVKQESLKLATRFFTPIECEYIFNSDNPKVKFFEIWTKKEAYIKMLGLGFNKPISSFNVLDLSLGVNFHTTSIDNFQLSICIKDLKFSEMSIKYVNQNELLSYF